MDFYKIDIGEEEPTVVHKSELYGFYRPDKLKEGNDDEHRSLEEVKESIKRELEEAFKLGEEYAKRIVKRLWLQWHPERNLRNEEYSSEIFKFIQTEVTRLRGDSSDSFWSSGTVFTTYIQRGSVFIQKKRNFCQMGYRGYSWGNGYWRAPNNSKNPQPGEAWRWFRQAKFDLEASRSDMAEENYEWLCFKCHQAAEKFLRSAVYIRDATEYNHHFLETIASATENTTLTYLAGQIESLLQSSAALRYPNRWRYPCIPHDKYDAATAEEALRITEKIFKEVEKIVHKG